MSHILARLLIRKCCVQVCELPSVLAYPLFYKLITPGETTVSHSAVRTWLAQRQITQVWQSLQLPDFRQTCIHADLVLAIRHQIGHHVT